MKILVTGTDGYIGCVLSPILQKNGHEVVGLDTGYYRTGWLYSDQGHNSTFPYSIHTDLRRIDCSVFEGIDAVVHLAELSNDPLGENNPEITYAINHQGSVALAKAAKEAGVKRFVYTSSCSVYGVGDGGFLDEADEVNPQTAYAKCKVLVERDVGQLADDDFEPVFLRNATAFGASPRMRFDIVLNNLMGMAWVERSIGMTSDGTPWRPLVHVMDICLAINECVTAPRQAVFNEVFNVGSNEENYQISEIASIVGSTVPGCTVTIGQDGGDNRSYRVNFDKIHSHLDDFNCKWTAEKGAAQLLNIFERIQLSKELFEAAPFTRLKQLNYLISTGQLDDQLFWTDV